MVEVPLRQVPSILLQTLVDDFGEFAPRAGRFDRTDVVMVGRNRRLAFFWNADSKWIVATEHGGFGYNNPIYIYHIDGDGRKAGLMAQTIAFPETLCTVAASL